jgi:hypothetical protein
MEVMLSNYRGVIFKEVALFCIIRAVCYQRECGCRKD